VSRGKVYLIGAGPGDPELLTCKGHRILAQADAILFDHLAPAALLDLAPASAERLYVGKKKSLHSFTQEEICAMTIERAQRGLTVVRLKGGDPFLFGRGGEEAETIARAGIPFEVVPGVTAPLGIAAYAGVPLTHRGSSSSVSFVSGHAVDAVDWKTVGQADTLVIFMGVFNFAEIARELIAAGRSPDTPALAVRWATRPDQESLEGTLSSLPQLMADRGMKPPATIVIGEVVRLREKLSWFERLPLFGRRIVNTRAKGQAEALTSRLKALGAEVIEMPAIEIRPAADSGPLDRALRELNSYDWLIFTSANGVRFFLERLDASAVDLRALRAKICAIGPATRAAIAALHLKVDVMGREYVAEGLLAALAPYDLAGRRVLLPRAAVARDLVPAELARRGAQVDVVEAYRTVAPEGAGAQAAAIFSGSRKPDCITFTSSSTVENFVAAAGTEALAGVMIASIGPVTTATARRLELQVDAEAGAFTVDGLVEAVVGLYTEATP